jgi:hypothetical protein
MPKSNLHISLLKVKKSIISSKTSASDQEISLKEDTLSCTHDPVDVTYDKQSILHIKYYIRTKIAYAAIQRKFSHTCCTLPEGSKPLLLVYFLGSINNS